MRSWIFSLIFLFVSLAGASGLSNLPIQDGGRIKPFETFARESLAVVYGKEKFEGRPAVEIIMTWVLQPQMWSERPLVEIRHNQVKKYLRFPDDKKYFSVREIMTNDRLSLIMQELEGQRQAKAKMDPFFQAVQRLESQLFIFKEIASGKLIRILPPKEGESWLSLPELSEAQQMEFLKVTQAFVATLSLPGADSKGVDPRVAAENLDKAVIDFKKMAQAENPALYPSESKINVEVHYNNFHPFRWTWIIYLVAFLCLGLIWIFHKPVLYKLGWAFAGLGLLLHVYGFALRMYLIERAPVSNMYETVVWVGFGALIFAMVIEAIYRWRFILLAGTAVAAFCLILADMAPVVLDSSLHPLEPVLRSNFWLTIHVLTITISYAAFFLAFALGDIGLFYYLKNDDENDERIKAITLSIYRSMQIGTAFLAPGIILGGIWADYSWGRFWGWDPKETWALIALLGYLAVLHARLSGLLKSFGMVCTSVLTFSLIIMAWYGVNFVLGAGLHSYGFGAGGVEYVAAFVAFHILFVIFVTVVRRGRLASHKK